MIWKNIKEIIKNKHELTGSSIVKEDLLSTKNFNVVFVSLKKGQEIPPHPENYAVFFLIIQGEAIFTTSKGQIRLKENSSIFYDENDLRGITSEEDLILLGIQQPH